MAVEIGVDGDGRHAQLPARAHHPDGDLAAVGHQHLGEHGPYRAVMARPDARPGPDGTSDRSAGAAGTRFTDVRHHAEVDSTNRVAADLVRSGAGEGLVVVAGHQTAGRGRRGRTWEDPPGSSLLVSVVLRPPAGPAAAA